MPPKAQSSGKKDILVHVNLAVLEASDPHLLAELCADPKIGAFLSAQIAPTVAVGGLLSADAIRDQALKLGHMPRTLTS